MQRDLLFKSRLSRKLFGYFLALAFIPILAFGYVAQWQTSRQMEETHEQYLYKTAEMLNQLFFNRLIVLEDRLLIQASATDAQRLDPLDLLADSFSALHRIPLETLDKRDATHLATGRTILRVHRADPFHLELLARTADKTTVIVGLIRPEALWGIPEDLPLPLDTDIAILDPDGEALFETSLTAPTFPDALRPALVGQIQGKFSFDRNGSPRVCFSRELFLESRFLFPRWTIALCQEPFTIHESQTRFMALFPLIVALCLGLVLYLILVLIRRNLAPLSQLRAMANRVSRQEFTARVDIHSGDEIEELGGAFNTMTVQLERQFLALETQARIDREILSSLDPERTVSSVLEYFTSTFTPTCADLLLREHDQLRLYHRAQGNDISTSTMQLDAASLHKIWRRIHSAGWLRLETIPELRQLLGQEPHAQGLACAIPRHGTPMGVLCLGMADACPPDAASLEFASRTLNQIAVAFANIQLLRELREFNWGTLEALARAVDEKSSWTAGHSQRVAALAIDLATHMGWAEPDLDLLHRAALLHDLGKIGISTDILDKPGRLDELEFEIIKTHPDRGARILEPIPAFAPVIPLIRHHHERHDGTGYPMGLAGEAIPPGARLLAIVDVYDALTTHRPYRQGWEHARTCDYLLQNSGSLFDPLMVQAFVSLR